MWMNKRRSVPTLRQLVPPAANSNCEYLYVCVSVCGAAFEYQLFSSREINKGTTSEPMKGRQGLRREG